MFPLVSQDWLIEQRESCRRCDQEVRLPYALFPGERLTPPHAAAITLKRYEVERALAHLGGVGINVLMVGCVCYESDFSSERHHTSFSFSVLQAEPGWILPVPGTGIPLQQLRLGPVNQRVID